MRNDEHHKTRRRHNGDEVRAPDTVEAARHPKPGPGWTEFHERHGQRSPPPMNLRAGSRGTVRGLTGVG
jgi:hypothetical protein